MEKRAFFGNPNIINWQMQSPDAVVPLPGLSSGHLSLIWDQTVEQTAKFDSALSSHVSSPSSNPPAAGIGSGRGDSVVIHELIGRLGSICNSDNISPASSRYQSANNSCYSTPINSPPKLNLSFVTNPAQMPISADPGFAERAARRSTISCSGRRSQFLLPDAEKLDEMPAVGNAKKRKAAPQKGKGKEASLASSITALSNPTKAAEAEGSNGKRSRLSEEAQEETAEQQGDATSIKMEEEKIAKPPDLSKDYIHVRARRGQATDSHSLAERVRREKISERMKLLQDLVPGCNKVTGKAVMLDEIINYVQSLQRQVEFLSMKLATVNPQLDFSMENIVAKNIEIHQNSVLLPAQSAYPLEAFSSTFSFVNMPERAPIISINGFELESHLNPLTHSNFNRHLGIQLPPVEGIADATYQHGALWDDDLQNVVQKGFIHNQEQTFSSQGSVPTNQMKVEL